MCVASNSLAGERADNFRQSADKIRSVLKKGDITSAMGKLRAMKEAGLTYQVSITAPLSENVYACKSQDELRAVRGILIFDSYYAALFGKKKELLDVGRQLNEVYSKLTLPVIFKPDAIRKIVDDPQNENNQDKIFVELRKYFDELVDASAKDPKSLLAILESLHGFNLEALYIYSSLALAAHQGSTHSDLFDFPLERITLFDNALKAISPKDKELLALVERDQRQALYTPIITVLKQRKGHLSKTDLETILYIIKPERDRLLRKCN
jgi:hypothetical protein